MTLSGSRQLRMVIVVVSVLVAVARLADRAEAQSPMSCLGPNSCVPLTLTANLQLTNLHSAVTHVQMRCTGKIAVGNGETNATSSRVAVVNRAFTGSVTAGLSIPRWVLADPTTRTVNATCQLELVNGTSTKAAVASATQPVGMLTDNWHVVAAGSTVQWTQAVTFPNANVP